MQKGFAVWVPPTCLSRFESNRREAKLTSPGTNREVWKSRHSLKIARRFVRRKVETKC